jgi:magnesium-transporting ATPase (P-type)
MYLKGILPSKDGKMSNEILQTKKVELFLQNENLTRDFVRCMACCHSVIVHEGKMMGDQMELELFVKTNFVISEVNGGGDYEARDKASSEVLTIVKRYDFSSETQCMSVMVESE